MTSTPARTPVPRTCSSWSRSRTAACATTGWTKLPLYARAGVAEAWLVDLRSQEIEVASGPSEEGYRRSIRVDRDGTVAPTAFPELSIAAARILG